MTDKVCFIKTTNNLNVSGGNNTIKVAIKKVISAVMVIAIAIAVAVPIRAEADKCSHPLAKRTKTSLYTHYEYDHEIRVYSGDKELIQNCHVGVSIYNCSYVCTSCHKITGDCYEKEEVKDHHNPLCNGD